MAIIGGTPEQLANIIKDGIASTLEQNIKAKLMEVVDPIVSELARFLAQETAVNVQSYIHHDPLNYQPKVIVQLSFNNQRVNYETTGPGERAHVGRTVGSSDESAASSS